MNSLRKIDRSERKKKKETMNRERKKNEIKEENHK